MRVLLSTVGSRGEVEPMVALASASAARGDEAALCAPPDFAELAGSVGIRFVPVGPSVRGTARQATTTTVPTAEQRQQMIEGTVAAQFDAVGRAAEGCDVVAACGALAIAARSVAESRGIPHRRCTPRSVRSRSRRRTTRRRSTRRRSTRCSARALRPPTPTGRHSGPRTPGAGTSDGVRR